MPGPRLPMRRIRDVLRLSATGMSKRQIAASLGVSATAAGAWEGRLSPTMRQNHVAGERIALQFWKRLLRHFLQYSIEHLEYLYIITNYSANFLLAGCRLPSASMFGLAGKPEIREY